MVSAALKRTVALAFREQKIHKGFRGDVPITKEAGDLSPVDSPMYKREIFHGVMVVVRRSDSPREILRGYPSDGDGFEWNVNFFPMLTVQQEDTRGNIYLR